MGKFVRFKSIVLLSLTVAVVCAIVASCTKIAGHTVTTTGSVSTGTGGTGSTGGTAAGCIVPTAGAAPNTNGIGNIVLGAVNSIVFQVNNGTTYTIVLPLYGFAPFFQSTGSATNGPLTGITAINLITGDNVNMDYDGLVKGTYVPEYIYIVIPGLNLSSSTTNGGTEKINVTTETVNGSTAGMGSFSGTVVGTFDGYMLDSCRNKIRVAGSFNVSK